MGDMTAIPIDDNDPFDDDNTYDRRPEYDSRGSYMSDDTYTDGSHRQSVIGGFDGTSATRVELRLVDGSTVAATVDSGGVSAGDTLFWTEVTEGVARVTAFDDSGDVVADHRIRDCDDPVDCEVR